jgi:hypothetical protein
MSLVSGGQLQLSEGGFQSGPWNFETGWNIASRTDGCYRLLRN